MDTFTLSHTGSMLPLPTGKRLGIGLGILLSNIGKKRKSRAVSTTPPLRPFAKLVIALNADGLVFKIYL